VQSQATGSLERLHVTVRYGFLLPWCFLKVSGTPRLHLKGNVVAHIVLTLAEWRAIAHELQGVHRAQAPAGLNERLHALFREAPRDWLDQPYAIDLDAASIEAVWAMHATLKNCRLVTADEHMGVLAAMEIIYQHQQSAEDA
jgi:hypothetical protein